MGHYPLFGLLKMISQFFTRRDCVSFSLHTATQKQYERSVITGNQDKRAVCNFTGE
jgi:hypothetical protein